MKKVELEKAVARVLQVHNQFRKEALIKTLSKSKEQAEIALLYLSANECDMNEVFSMRLAMEHIEIALEQLGKK